MDVHALSKPFPEDVIKQRKGPNGKMLDYVEIASVLRRLNTCTDGQWSFRILWPTDLSVFLDPEAVDRMRQVGVLGELIHDGQQHQQFGSSLVTRDSTTGEAVSIWDDLKAAASDSLKKAATHFGVALYLYEKEDAKNKASHTSGGSKARSSSKRNPPQNPPGGNATGKQGQGGISNRQIQEVMACATQKGYTQDQVRSRVAELFDGRKLEELSYDEGTVVIQRIKASSPTAA